MQYGKWRVEARMRDEEREEKLTYRRTYVMVFIPYIRLKFASNR